MQDGEGLTRLELEGRIQSCGSLPHPQGFQKILPGQRLARRGLAAPVVIVDVVVGCCGSAVANETQRNPEGRGKNGEEKGRK